MLKKGYFQNFDAIFPPLNIYFFQKYFFHFLMTPKRIKKMLSPIDLHSVTHPNMHGDRIRKQNIGYNLK